MSPMHVSGWIKPKVNLPAPTLGTGNSGSNGIYSIGSAKRRSMTEKAFSGRALDKGPLGRR